jgi:acetoacetate decarboxylase
MERKNAIQTDPDHYYRMPLIMGPLTYGQNDRIPYTSVEVLALQYLTDAEAIPALLPACYRPADEPLVTLYFGHYDGLDFMAGGGYRVATAQVAARYDGEQDHVEGDYVLVMFEDQTWPIIGGREDLGIPKLYADISPVKVMLNGHLRCEASLWGHTLFGLDLAPPRRQNVLVRWIAGKRLNARPWLGYKYIPSLDGPPDADYPTTTRNDVAVERLWLARSGTITYGTAGREDVGHARPIVDALRALPVRRVVQALRFQGSAVLRYDLSRRLR